MTSCLATSGAPILLLYLASCVHFRSREIHKTVQPNSAPQLLMVQKPNLGLFNPERASLSCACCWCRRHYELGEFVPRSLLRSVERSRRGRLVTSQTSGDNRTLRRRLNQLIDETRRARNKAGKPLTSLQIKLHYLRVISQLPSYGTRCFLVRTISDMFQSEFYSAWRMSNTLSVTLYFYDDEWS